MRLRGESRENEMGLVAAITKGDDGFLRFALLEPVALISAAHGNGFSTPPWKSGLKNLTGHAGRAPALQKNQAFSATFRIASLGSVCAFWCHESLILRKNLLDRGRW